MKKVTNKHKIDLPMAIWLLQNGYNSGADVAPEGELLSVTTLLKPTRQLILQRQVDMDQETIDLDDLIASRMGHSLHEGIEQAWTHGNWQQAMKRLGYNDEVIGNIVINPEPADVKKDQIPIYLEKRGFKEIAGIVLTGQLDFSIAGAYRDFKSTSTYSFTSGSKDMDYILQGSMYRYIMPDYIWKDTMRIEFIFTDWLRYRAKADPNYPQSRVVHKEYNLLSLEETEEWILNKIDHIKQNVRHTRKQDKLVRCSDKDLWKGDDTYKYYSNPENAKKGGRCQKSFTSLVDANLHLQAKGKGTIVTVPGEVKACNYCPAFAVCEQRKEYFPDD